MKKLLLMATAAFGMALGVQAQTLSVPDNEIFVVCEDLDDAPTATVSVNLANTVATRDVQFDVVVPEGYYIDPDNEEAVKVSGVAKGYEVAFSDGEATTGGTKYTFILYTTNPDAAKIPANGGEVLTIVLDNDDPELWADLTSGFSAAKWTNDDAAEASLSTTAYTFQVGLLADVNKDKVVDPADVAGVFNYISSNTTVASLGKFAAIVDINEDGVIDPADVAGIFNKIAASSSSVKAEVEFDAPAIPADVEIDWAD